MPGSPRAIVFAYHDVGVRCLRTLLAHGVDVPLVITHEDNPSEQIWFDSVARHAAWHGIPCITPADVHAPEVMAQLRAARPEFLFSFYYRSMLREDVLALAPRGAYNMHGSLLPKYRGRVPVNWAVLKGETHTGATLHRMAVKPDAGDIVAQQAVPILPDDTAGEVFRKVCVAAEIALDGVLPALLAGTAVHSAQDLAAGSYYGGRTAKDGALDWRLGVQAVHNLVRAVAPPYPGAFGQAGGLPLRVLRTRIAERSAERGARHGAEFVPELFSKDGAVFARVHDGVLQLLEFELGAEAAGVKINDAQAFERKFGATPVALRAYLE